MSRGFVKEEDQEEAPLIPPRAALPPGATNYVTPRGLRKLEEERKQLEQERAANKQENETERRRTNMLIDGKLNLLDERIRSARVLDPDDQPHDEVRFGATVGLRAVGQGKPLNFTIVGVDEASVKEGRIAFVAPIAKAVTGHKKGEEVSLKLGDQTAKYQIESIEYKKPEE